jgi:hypothetical protein
MFRVAIPLIVFAVVQASIADADSLSLAINEGLCLDGAYPSTAWPGNKRPDGLRVWGSYCDRGDNTTGRAESQAFPAPSVLTLYLAGYLGLPGRNPPPPPPQSGDKISLTPESLPGESWRLSSFPVPSNWIGAPARLAAEDTAVGLKGWLAFSEPINPAPSRVTSPSPASVTTTNPIQEGFCQDGVYAATAWPGDVRPPGVISWGSFCQSGDAGTGWKASNPIQAGSLIGLYVAGYPSTRGISLAVENLETGQRLVLHAPYLPRETWQRQIYLLPAEWTGRRVRVVAQDQATGAQAWVGFSEPVPVDLGASVRTAAGTLGLFILWAMILFLPSVAACMVAALLGVEDQVDLTAVALCALGLTGYVCFWIYFFSHTAGVTFSYAILLTSIAVAVFVLAEKIRRRRVAAVQQLAMPAGLIMLGGLFIVSLGLLNGGEDAPLWIVGERFAPPTLAGDNFLPKQFAEAVFAGHIPSPLVGDWLSSDRPPLQAGNAIWCFTWTSGRRDFVYLFLSVVLQCSFLIGLWSLLTAYSISRRCRALIVGVCFFSGFTFLNGIYTWPKLYPVGFLLVLTAYLLTPRFAGRHESGIFGVAVGVAAGLALLAHSASAFAFLGITVSMVVLRRYPSPRFLLGIVAGITVLYIPWMLYQKLYDPPGDRLLKWHIAGFEEPHPNDSFTELLIRNYRNRTPAEIARQKWSNFQTLGGDLEQDGKNLAALITTLGTGDVGTRNESAGSLRRSMYYYWIPCIGLSILGLPILFLVVPGRNGQQLEVVPARHLWLTIGMTLVVWCLVLFGPNYTIVHQGTYLIVVLAFAASWLAFWALSPLMALTLGIVQVVWNVILYVALTPVAPPSTSSDLNAVNPAFGIFSAACVLSGIAILWLLVLASGIRWNPGRTGLVWRSAKSA